MGKDLWGKELTQDILRQMYKGRNLKEELEWTANNTKNGYTSVQGANYISWLALAALDRIKELEEVVTKNDI